MTMTYYYDHMTYYKKQWFVHLKLPSLQEQYDSLEYMSNTPSTYKHINLLLNGAKDKDPKKGVDYKVVTKKHQMDQNGKLFVSSAWNIRGQTTQDREMGINTPLDPQAVGYATQYDFDKYCFDNPDSRYPFDWNAEVYKAFISPCRATLKVVNDTCSDEEMQREIDREIEREIAQYDEECYDDKGWDDEPHTKTTTKQ